jgi:uncharacterized delta-60 repeat protein
MKTKSIFLKNKYIASFALAMVIVLVMSSCGRPPLVGILDRIFGSNGIETVDLGSNSDSARSVVIQPDGKIVILGTAQNQTPILMRFDSGGNIDNTFGVDGKLSINFGIKVSLQSNGKLIVAGTSRGSLAVARYDSNGNDLDNTFGINGVALIPSDPGDFMYVCSDLAIQTDDKIVLIGTQESGGHTTTIVVARFTSDGAPDTTFDASGLKYMDESDFPDSAYFRGEAVVNQPDDKIVLSANMYDSDAVEQIALARLEPDGSPDASIFGTNGKGTVAITLRNFQSSGGGLDLQEDGKIVVLGNIFNPNDDLALARFNTNGSLDPGFGGSGIVVTDFGEDENGNDLVIQPDGKIVVVGKSSNAKGSDILLVRYNSDGSLDNTFGVNGKVITDLGNTPDAGNNAALQTDGKLVVAGSSDGDALLMRYR